MAFDKTIPDRIRGVFLGVAIGDALGMPVETFTKQKIKDTYGRVTEYKTPTGHKWFDGKQAGTTTDDTQLTLAVANALIESPFSIDAQVKHHMAAFKETTDGWGRTTRESVQRLINGSTWENSGALSGLGNGVPMKVAPVGMLLCLYNSAKTLEILSFLNRLTSMTHNNRLVFSAAYMHGWAISLCFVSQPETLRTQYLLSSIASSSRHAEQFRGNDTTELLSEKMKLLPDVYQDTDKMIEAYKGGTCYCANSVPFAYGFFARNFKSIDCLYDVVSAGGDTDTNGSLVGALLGALHGTKVFPQHLVDGLVGKDKIIEVADKFVEKFGNLDFSEA